MNTFRSIVDTFEVVNADRCAHMNNDSLLCYAVSVLDTRSVPATFENVTVAAFRLFPDQFSLIGYPNYPDASRINRTLLHARPKYRDLIVGNAKSGYALTPKGKAVAQQVAVDLEARSQARPANAPPGPDSKRTYTGGSVVEHIQKSSLYRHWAESDTSSIGDYEVWDFLEAMPYTDRAMLQNILRNYKEGAELAGRKDLVEFLSWVSSEYRHVFHGGER